MDLLALLKAHWVIFLGCLLNYSESSKRGAAPITIVGVFYHFVGCLTLGIGGWVVVQAYIEISQVQDEMFYTGLGVQLLFAGMGPNGMAWTIDKALEVLLRKK